MTSQLGDFGLLNQGASRLGEDESDPSSEDEIYPEPEEPEFDLVQGSNTGFVERGKPDKEAASAHAPVPVKKSDKGKDKPEGKDKDKNKKDPPPLRTTTIKPPPLNPAKYPF
ncbi:hypothetical protein M405DRAFT_822022, partial [Rhizopogon salebrosus TDB-379]